ncbi:MAG: site-specific integrase, partial [Gammaproteobacteria bacterium]|nr:site-specific integrase [Gammaproteobacteria bacterium]
MDESKIWDGWNIRDCGVKPDGGEALRRYERRRKYRNERIGILSIVEKINPRLIYGHRDIKCTDDEVSKLLERIAENSESIRVKQGHNFLVQGLEAGKKKLGWKINVPSPMVNIKRDSSPFRPSQFHTLKKLYLIINRFNESIEDEYYYKNSSSWKKQNNNTKEIFIKNYHAGQILLSAIVNGGILSKKWLDGFGDALKHRVVIDDDYLWLDLEVNIKNSTRKDHRRWFADPVTGLLILKWKNKYGDTWIDDTTNIGQRKQNELCIRNFFRGMGLKYKDSFPVSKLINSASTLLSMSLPQFLIKYAESPTMSPSLSPLTWIRLRHDRQGIINKEENKKDEIVDIDINIRTNNTKVTTGDQIKNLRKLQSILGLYHHRNAPSIGEICKKIESFIDSAQLNPIVAYLAYWCLIRMRSTRLTGSKVKPSSMNTYLSTIGTDLIRNMIEYNPVELDEEDWMEIYEKVIDSGANNKIKNRRKRRLREFHDFLVVYEGFPKVYFSGCEQEENIVDVNIISPKEYMQILLVLSQDSYDSERLRKIRRIVFTLGYRCGLRRKEVLTIQIRNLQILDCKGGNAKEGSELLIVSNSQGKLKTKKSTRRIPLEYLLTDEEFEELYQWKQKRIREVKGSKIVNQLLFCNIANDIEVLSDKELFQPIHFAMRMVTGDYSLHYQNLRHSFATMLILRLTQDSYKNILPESWVTENGKYLLPLENESILDKLLNRSEFRPTRKNVYLVSNLCGHNGPKETLDTYIHCLDWIMGRVLHEHSETLSLKKQAYLLGQSRGS